MHAERTENVNVYRGRFIDRYTHFGDDLKATFSAMVSVVDESVKNVTNALKSRELWGSTLFVWTTDNGSPVGVGGSNHPLRGGKGSSPPCPV